MLAAGICCPRMGESAMGVRAWWPSLLAGFAGVLAGVAVILAVGRPSASPAGLSWPVPAVARRVAPSVVVVLNQQRESGGTKTRGVGSGVVFDRQGDIVTNYHVVRGAARVVVILADGHRASARVIGVDPPTDLAVIRVRAPRLVPIHLASSSGVEPGELVVAIGNSLGLVHSITVGVISATDRTLYRQGWPYHLIQTDAAINPGNSGGPLVDMSGGMIGINSSKIVQTGIEGIGFAVPSNTVRYVADQLIRFGKVRRPWLGAVLQGMTGPAPGLLVVAVTPGGPVARAGLLRGDIITRIDASAVRSVQGVVQILSSCRVGQRVVLTVWRGGEPRQLRVQLGAEPSRRSLAGTT